MTDPVRLVVHGTIGIVILATVASGPLVGAVSFTDERITAMDVAPGDANVGEIAVPEGVTLTYEGDGRYRYEGTPPRVDFERITGGDVQLTYGLLVPALNTSQSVTRIVSGPTTNETVVVDFYDYVSGDPVDAGRYEAVAYVALVTEGEHELVTKRPVPVEVANGRD